MLPLVTVYEPYEVTMKDLEMADVVNRIIQLTEIKRAAQALCNTKHRNRRGLLVTSPLPGEGKTIITAGLATRIASQTDQRVLVVDLNWNNPALHLCFRKKRTFDYSELTAEEDPHRFVKKTDFSGLDIMTAPKFQNPELAGDPVHAITGKLNSLADMYDRVILDSSAIFPVNRQMMDPVYFSEWAGETLLVIMGGKTPRDIIRKAVHMFDKGESELVGVIMNQWKNPL